jgi:hypothetical protein
MRRGVSALVGVLALSGLCACPPPGEELSAEAVAAAFGLVDGRVMHFAVEQGGSTTEDHSFARSSSYAERYVVTRTEQTQGFIRVSADGTAAVTDFETTADAEEETGEVLMVARGDCLPRCLDYDPPVLVAAYPWTAGARQETSSTATVHEGEQTSTLEERHVFTVGSEGQLSTEAGDFDVFELSWQRFVDGGEAEYATLYLSPEVGLIGLDRFDGASLRLTSQEN